MKILIAVTALAFSTISSAGESSTLHSAKKLMSFSLPAAVNATPIFETKGRSGSKRVGGYTKSGKGSRYVGGRR